MKSIVGCLCRIFFCVTCAICILAGCAKQGYPSGGPRDTDPPKPGRAEPASGTLEFGSNTIFIEFDEYVTLKDPDHNVLVSPPLSHRPEYTTKGHGVQVRLHDTLRTNTTYIFSFQEAIADYNEGNILPRLDYVVSTGAVIDSMQIDGRVVDALTGEPTKETVTIAAYAIDDDSAVVKSKPDYITRCNGEGRFVMRHLPAGRYRLVAMEDANSNLHYDASEPVAWTDTFVVTLPMSKPAVPRDTATTDTIAGNNKIIDSTARSSKPAPAGVEMFLSIAERPTQRVLSSAFLSPGVVQIVTLMPLSLQYSVMTMRDSGSIEPHSFEASLNASRDTLKLWTADNAACDSLNLIISDTGGFSDTLKLLYRPKKSSQKNVQTTATPLLRSLVATNHPYYDTLWLAFSRPVYTMPGFADGDSIVKVTSLADSNEVYVPWHWASDRQPHLRAYIDFHGEPGAKYRFKLSAGVFHDLWDTAQANRSDSLLFTTQYTKPENYGSIKISLADGDWNMRTDGYPLIVQLLGDKDHVLSQQILDCDVPITDTTIQHVVHFQNLLPAKYRIRVIADYDRDGRWTAGDYWLRRQPERVLYFPKTLDVKANWHIEEKWDIDQ